MKKVIIGTTASIVVFSLFGLYIYKSKDTHADEYISVYEEIENIEEVVVNKFEDKKSEYIEGEKPLYVDGMIVVNKQYGLPKDFNPSGGKIENEVIEAFEEMKEAAKKDGITINIRSGYRSYNTQKQLYNAFVRRDGEEEANRYSAKPGYSEHQTGLAIDITNQYTNRSIGSWFNDTPQAKWLYENAHKYGFILRYPEGKEHIPGYKSDSWHYRYIGKEHSENFNMNNLTLEEYFGLYEE